MAARDEDERDGKQSGERDYTVRAVARVCAILNLLQESPGGVGLPSLADSTDLPRSSAYRYLWTLEKNRYVEDAGDSFHLGLGFVGMQSRHLEILRDRAHPWLQKMRDTLKETATLGILDGDSVVYLDIVEARRGVRVAAKPGDRDPLHATALGKAIAGQLPEQRVRDILTLCGMPPRTTNTITTIDRYLDELAKVRRLGYAVDDGENEVDGRCVAAPILHTGLPAAISISAPLTRLSIREVDTVAAHLCAAAESMVSVRESGAELN